MTGLARLTNLTVQTVLQSSNGVDVRVTDSALQIVVRSTPRLARVTGITTQTVIASTPKLTRVAALLAQVLIRSSAGGYTHTTFAAPQVVYTVGVPDTSRQNAWTFDFDGHTFYVLDLGDRGAMVYDLTTQSWSRWDTAGYDGHFNMKNGFHWRDGKMVVGGGLLDGLLVRLDESAYLDEDFRPVAYEVNGVVFASAERYIRQYALRLVGSPGRTGLVDLVTPPVLRMQYSDDNGATWSTERAVTLTSNTEERIEFRSLGAFRQPGRIFRLYDSGGIKFIAYVAADVEGE